MHRSNKTLLASSSQWRTIIGSFNKAARRKKKKHNKKTQKKTEQRGHMIKYLLTEFGQAGKGKHLALGHDLEPNIFPSGSVNKYIVCYPYVSVCTCMLPVCYSYVTRMYPYVPVCYPYVTSMYPYASYVTRMLPVCYS